MSGTGDSGGVAPRVDEAAKAALLALIRAGGCIEAAAAALGLTLRAFYFARERDPAFDEQWKQAHQASAGTERRRLPPPAGESGEMRIAPNNRRVLQKRRIRHVKFDEKRRQIFLAHFAATCDSAAAAAEAGVCERTVLNRRRSDPEFAEEHDSALDQGYVRLETEALRSRLEEQRRLRSALEACGDGAGGERAALSAEAAADFERVLKLLARADRKPRRPRRTSGGPHKVWTCDSAIALLDKRLKALAVPVPALPPEVAARFDGEEAGTATGGVGDSHGGVGDSHGGVGDSYE